MLIEYGYLLLIIRNLMSKQPVNILKFISFRQSKHPKQLRRAPTLKESIKYGPKLLLEDQSQKV